MGQGQTMIGRDYVPALGVAFALLLFLLAHFAAARPALAQAQNGISEPENGAALSGVVSIRGTATHEAFLRYELAFSNGADWLVFAQGDRPVVADTLAIWDTTIGQPANPVFPDGIYELRLRVVRQDHNYDEYFVRNLTVSNAMTPTPTETATIAAQPTSGPGTPAPQASPTSGLFILRPTPLPSLTPFPTPSVPAAPAGSVTRGTPGALGSGESNNGEGLLQRLLAIETGRYGSAFWVGVRLTLYAFMFVALYLLLRAIVRYAWRHIWARVYRQE